jgi:hypothetical protein
MKVIWVHNATMLTGLAKKVVILWYLVVDSSATSCSCTWCWVCNLWMHLCRVNEQDLEQLCVQKIIRNEIIIFYSIVIFMRTLVTRKRQIDIRKMQWKQNCGKFHVVIENIYVLIKGHYSWFSNLSILFSYDDNIPLQICYLFKCYKILIHNVVCGLE